MKNTEFITIATANANKTARIRIYSGNWISGASRIPDELSKKIGYIINLIHAQIDEGKLCESNEGLLIYNFQPIAISETEYYCSIAMLIKPLDKLNETNILVGTPLQLVINANTGEITNNEHYMLASGLITQHELDSDKNSRAAISYGVLSDYRASTSFIALASYRPLSESDLQDLFKGKFNSSEMVKKATAFDSIVDAKHYLSDQHELGRYIAEVAVPRQELESLKEKGLGKEIVKVIDYFNDKVTVILNEHAKDKEHNLGDELMRLKDGTQSHKLRVIQK